MVSEVSMFSGPGASLTGPGARPAGDDAASDGFAALIAHAGSEPGKAPQVAQEAEDGVIHRAFIAEWCLAAPDPDLEDSSEGSTVAAPEDEGATTPEANAGDDAELPPQVVCSIDWLRAQPPQPARADQPEADASARTLAAAGTSARDASVAFIAPSAPAADLPPSGSIVPLPPDGVSMGELSPMDASAPAATPVPVAELKPALESRPQMDRAGQFQIPEAPGDDLSPAQVSPVPVAADFVDGSAAVVSQETPAQTVSRGKAAAFQLSRAIERLGGPFVDNPLAHPAAQAHGDPSSGERRSSSSSAPHPHDSVSAGHAGSAPQAGASAFTAQVTADLQRHSAIAASGVGAGAFSSALAPDADTAQQIVQAIRVQFRDGIGDAVVRLKPEHLGEVSVSLRVEQQSVSATVHAEVAAVRHWLESQEASLRNNLSEQGLHLEKFVVREDESGRREEAGADDHAQEQNRQHARNRRGETETTFEVVV